MRKLLAGLLMFLLTALIVPALAEVSIDQDHFPDQAFRMIVREFDLNKDNKLSENEIIEATVIDLSNEKASALLADFPVGITSFDGIEYLTALTELNCSSQQTSWSSSGSAGTGNHLTLLDLSMNSALKELRCYGNRLEKLILGNNTSLIYLDCHDNSLSSLDLRGNTSLRQVYCFHNKLETLLTGTNSQLEYLDCSHNQLLSLDISGSTGLMALRCNDNYLTTLDISACEELQQLDCNRNELQSLNITANNTALTRINCSNNHLISLIINGQRLLKDLYVDNNNLTSLDVSDNRGLKWLSCQHNRISVLNLEKNTNLEKVNCSHNQLTELILGNNKLTSFLCSDNRLASLNLSKNPDLQELQCQNNRISNLDITKNAALSICVCYNNRLEELDLSNSHSITILETYGNKIRNLYIGNCDQFYAYLDDSRTHNDLNPVRTDDGHNCFLMSDEVGLALVFVFDPYTHIKRFKTKGEEYTNSTDAYTVTVHSGKNGNAYASTEIGQKDDTVFLFAEPEPGYKLKEWQVKSGNVSIIDNYFKLGIDDVEIQAVFVPKGE